jgi:hypothetical protein
MNTQIVTTDVNVGTDTILVTHVLDIVLNGGYLLVFRELIIGIKALFLKTLILEEFEDTKGVIKIRISKKNRQHNGQKKK